MVWLAYFVVMGSILGSGLFALWKGDKPLRYGAILRFAVLIPGLVIQQVLSKTSIPHAVWLPIFELSATAIMAGGFLWLAMRYGSPWLALAMVIQGFDFYNDRIFLDADVQDRFTYGVIENFITTGVALALFFGTLAAIRERKKQRDAAAERAAKAQARVNRVEAMLAGHLSLVS